MTNPTTAAEYLALPDDKLGVAVAERLSKKPWKHESFWHFSGKYRCRKCDLEHEYDTIHRSGCSVPDAIDIKDFNVAMEWIRKSGRTQGRLRTWHALCHVSKIVLRKSRPIIWQWAIFHAEPKHYLIAAALAAEGAKE